MAVLSNTGVFEKFPTALNQPSDSGRRALVALGHFIALAVAMAAVSIATVGSILKLDSSFASQPMAFGAWAFAVLVAVGIVKDNFVHTVRGLGFVGGQAAAMAIGHYVLGDAVFFGWLYLGFAVVVAFVAGVVWLDVRYNGRPC